ncbi:MAG: formimidoylglutamase [Motiliproteus sp.]
MFEPMNPDNWQGRIDRFEEQPALRWHQSVRPIEQQHGPGIAILGVCCDEGVQRNQGRPGARLGPNAIRNALASQAWHQQQPLYDAGNIHCDDDNLAQLSLDQAVHIERLLQQGHFPLILGGGHEIAYGSYLGLSNFLASNANNKTETSGGPIGILNFDAHFDLRRDELPSSGTPFLQIAEHCQTQGQEFRYGCLGISETANTSALFRRADQLGVQYRLDEQLNDWQIDDSFDWLQRFIAPLSALYLTIDLDVLPAATMPGVSAPAARGLPLAMLEALVARIRTLAGERLKLADLAELNPHLDVDQRSAKVAARLCHQIVKPI